ncbi:carbohydrate-binding protein [Methanosphaerula subterraneus]|uniref:carbohydrate-binding protein n=1 Tax=Methanosphaerula subterraneus TaxID=3350244 RepID=UPI003F86C645
MPFLLPGASSATAASEQSGQEDMMDQISSAFGRLRALAPAALLLLALCLLVGGVQASYTPGIQRYVAGDVLEITAANQTDRIVVASVDTTGSIPYYTTFDVVWNAGRWEIPGYWNHDFTVDEQNLVENLQARRVGHVDPILVIITDTTVTGGDMQYTGLSLAEALAGVVYPVEPAPGESPSISPIYAAGDILGNVSDPTRGEIVSKVFERDNETWYNTYIDTVRSTDRWMIEKFYNGDFRYPESVLNQSDLRRVAHADPHIVIVNDTTTSTGEIGWYRLSLAEVLSGKSYDHMGNWHFVTGDILGNDTAPTRFIVTNATTPEFGPSHYTLHEVVRGADGWEIPDYVNDGLPLAVAQEAQLDAIPLTLIDHTDPHGAVVTDRTIAGGDITYFGLSLGEIIEGTPGYPPEEPPIVGGDVGYFLVSTAPAGASIYLEDLSSTRYPVGTTTDGPLNVTIHLTATPMRKVIATLSGYHDAVWNITQYPAKGQTVPVTLTLETSANGTPAPYKPLSVPGQVQAEDYDLGGEGIAYHDTTAGNEGGAYRQDDVDIETAGGITDVGWIRGGEWLAYTVNATTPQTVVLRLSAANPDATTKRVAISTNGTAAGTVDLRPTGSFGTFLIHDSTPFPLPAGATTVRLSFDGIERVNLDYLDFELPATQEPTPVPTPTPHLLISTPGLHTLDGDLSADGIGVLITSSDVVLDGMGHSIVGAGADGSIGVYATGLATPTSPGTIANVTIRNLSVRHWDEGIRVGGASETVVEEVVAEQNRVGISYGPRGGTTHDHVLRDSVLRENTDLGLALSYPAGGFAVERCSITGNGVGVSGDMLQSSDRTTNHIADCDVSENAGDGLTSRDGSFAVVRNCTFRANGDDGLEFVHGGAEIVGNRIEGNAGDGVHASDRGGCDIHGNWITGNGRGFVGGDWGSRVRNNYLNNTDNGYFGSFESGQLNYEKTGGANIVGGPYLGGNFWANPNGTGFSETHPDADRDGICDVPYVVNPEEGVTDYLPLAPSPGTPVVAPAPYTQHPVPGRIQAEEYDLGGEGIAYHDTTAGNEGGVYRHDDVDIETAGGITDVGWIRDGEWLIYTLNVPEGGPYLMTARVATPNEGLQAWISVNSEKEPFLIRFPKTGSFTTYTTAVEEYVSLPAGNTTVRLTFEGDGLNLDWIAFAPQPQTREPFQIPCTIQAEDYDLGGYVDTTPGNQGGAYRQDDVDIETGASGYDVGWIRTGEYLTYTVYVAEGGTYEMTARVASPNSGRTIVLSFFGETLATVAVPKTGSFDTYRTVSVPVTLTSGYHPLRLTFQGDGQNLDWIAFAPAGQTTTPTTPVPSGGASFVAEPTTAPHGSAVKFTLTPAEGKSIGSVLWSFDAPAHLETWNSRTVAPTFFYPAAGTFSPLVTVTYTDGSTETVQRTGYIRAT